ncbi:MAG: sugar phosphate isomerase/epimerase family protein [Ktedonobacteraceae bacterium]
MSSVLAWGAGFPFPYPKQGLASIPMAEAKGFTLGLTNGYSIEKSRRKMKLTYTSLACPSWTIEEAVRTAESYGYAAIEWRLADGAIIEPDVSADIRRRLREVPAAHGIEVACLDSSCRAVQAEPQECAATIEAGRRMLDLAAEIGAPFLRVFGGELPANTTRTSLLGSAAEVLYALGSYGAERDVTKKGFSPPQAVVVSTQAVRRSWL